MNVGGWLGWIVRANPLTYGVAGLRHYLQNGGTRSRDAACSRDVLAGVAGVCRCHAGGGLAHRRHAFDRGPCMNDPQKFETQQHVSGRFEHVPAPAPSCLFSGAAVLVAMAYGGWKWWQVRQFEQSRGQAIRGRYGRSTAH